MQSDNNLKSQRHLYQDFKLTTDNCASEPINRPIAIQGQGHMLVLDSEHKVYAASEGLAELLELETENLWTSPVKRLLPQSITQSLAACNANGYIPESTYSPVTLGSKEFDVVHHKSNGKTVIEFEPAADSRVADRAVRRFAQLLRRIDSNEELYSTTARQVADAFGFDRVMIYQFDEDKHGCVVGEHKIDSLEPFLGLHYPETDIPKMARDLFLLAKSRTISDVHALNNALIFNPSLGQNPPYLDLSYSQLRATSPIHIEYMKNMGVTASMTLAIILNSELWGLIACHHCSPRQVLFDHRIVGEAFADLMAKRLFELDLARRNQSEVRSRATEAFLLDQVKVSEQYRVDILEHANSLIELCEADGVALITLNSCVFSTGLVPSTDQLLQLCSWLKDNGHDEVFSTFRLSQDMPEATQWDVPIGGLLSACISSISQSYIMWFRHPTRQLVNWAGDPDNSYSVEKVVGTSEIKVSPRQSFAKWCVSVEGQSLRWDSTELEMAERVQQSVFKKELRHTAKLVARSNSEFMQLTYAAAHDLQEPLRTQANYLDLLQENLQDEQHQELTLYVNKTENAAARMSELVSDLLTYSRLDTDDKREPVDLTDVVNQLLEELNFIVKNSGAVIKIDNLPTLCVDRNKIKQLMQNLITNAIKYVAPGVAPEISIFIESDDSFTTLNVKDNGIGIDKQYHSKVFEMFQRLHGKNEYAGSGIGLALCAKVASSMDATLDIVSELGMGSTFRLKFHNSLIIN